MTRLQKLFQRSNLSFIPVTPPVTKVNILIFNFIFFDDPFNRGGSSSSLFKIWGIMPLLAGKFSVFSTTYFTVTTVTKGNKGQANANKINLLTLLRKMGKPPPA